MTEQAQAALEISPNDDEVFRAEKISEAHAYNDALESGALFAENAAVPVGDGTSMNDSFKYRELLNVEDDGFMGRLQYNALGIDLPIFHGTDSRTLTRGVGHLEGTSLPVGGVGSRSVLTAHRGLPTATLFSDLDQAHVGDTFTVSVLGEVLTYKVIETQVIKPDQTESIVADQDRDLVTLITCTPLGINSHRILVTAERITPTPPREVAAALAAPVFPGFPWWIVILSAALGALSLYVWRAGYVSRVAERTTTPTSPTGDAGVVVNEEISRG